MGTRQHMGREEVNTALRLAAVAKQPDGTQVTSAWPAPRDCRVKWGVARVRTNGRFWNNAHVTCSQ